MKIKIDINRYNLLDEKKVNIKADNYYSVINVISNEYFSGDPKSKDGQASNYTIIDEDGNELNIPNGLVIDIIEWIKYYFYLLYF